MSSVPPFRAFLDAGVPDSVGRVVAGFGHEPLYHRDHLPEQTPDLVVAATALRYGAVLLAFDRDMRSLGRHYGTAATNDRFATLSMIQFTYLETIAAKRLSHVWSLIQHEWAFTAQQTARRMWIEIGAHYIRSNR